MKTLRNNNVMKMIKKTTRRFILFILLTINLTVVAQDIHFSQFYMSPLTQNPAMAGVNHDLQAIVNYKEQWKSVSIPYNTIAASFDMRLTKKSRSGFLAVGINLFNDKSGSSEMVTSQANLSIAYHIQLAKFQTLGAGIQGGFFQRSINTTSLQWGNQYVNNAYNTSAPTGEMSGNYSFSKLDCGAGLVWNYNNMSGNSNVTGNQDLRFTAGFSTMHINRPNYSYLANSDQRLSMRQTLYGNALIGISNSKISIAPGFIYNRQGKSNELYFGAMVRKKLQQESKVTGANKGSAISLGAFYRVKDALAFAVLYEFSQFAVGMSYDVNLSHLNMASKSRGGLELSLRFVNPHPFLNKSQSRFH